MCLYLYNFVYTYHVKGQPFTKVHLASGFRDQKFWRALDLAQAWFVRNISQNRMIQTHWRMKSLPETGFGRRQHEEIPGIPLVPFAPEITTESTKNPSGGSFVIKIFPQTHWWWLWDLRQCVSLTSADPLELEFPAGSRDFLEWSHRDHFTNFYPTTSAPRRVTPGFSAAISYELSLVKFAWVWKRETFQAVSDSLRFFWVSAQAFPISHLVTLVLIHHEKDGVQMLGRIPMFMRLYEYYLSICQCGFYNIPKKKKKKHPIRTWL